MRVLLPVVMGAGLILAAAPTVSAQTPSFPCNRAQSPREIAVCADGGLAALDRTLDQAYRRARDAVGSRASVLSDQQRQWLRSVDERCGLATGRPTPPTGIACIADRYRERIAALGGAPPPAPPSPTAPAAPPIVASPAAPLPPEAVRPVGAATVSVARVPAKGRSDAILTVTEAGRFAIEAKSAQGTSIELVDRVLGPIASAGGRLDATLEPGRYKLVLRGDERAEGDAALSVEPFAAVAGTPPLLAEGQLLSSSLADRQQRSFWFQVPRAGPVFVRVFGRDVADLSLSRGGTQTVDAVVSTSVVEPTAAQPLRVVTAWVNLEAGTYLLTAFGGVGPVWAQESPDHPLDVQVGLRAAAEAGRVRGTLGRTGVAAIRVPASVTYVRLTVPETAPVRLSASELGADGIAAIDEDDIDKSRAVPMAELTLPKAANGVQGRLIEVAGSAGQPYLLSFLHQGDQDIDEGESGLWVSSFYLGSPEAVAAATALLADSDGQVLNAQAVRLGTGAAWSTRLNLLSPAQIWLEVANAGRYTVGVGNDAGLKLCPAGDAETCQTGTGALTADLDTGIYNLAVTPAPKAKGVVDLAIRASGVATARPAPLLPANRSVEIGSHGAARLQFGAVPGVVSGAVIRAEPVSLGEDLPGVGRLQLKVAIPGAGTLTALAEDGRALPIAVGSAPAAPQPAVAKGTSTVTVDAGGDTWFSLHFEPSAPPLPPPPAAIPAPAPLAGLPTLALGQPAFLDLGGNTIGQYRLDIAEAGLYRVTSLGRLQVAGEIRHGPTLVDRAEGNGAGHNVLIQRFLRDGSYAVAVHAAGRTAGRAAVAVARVPVAERGAFALGAPFRARLTPDAAVQYRVDVAKAGDYRVELYGHGTMPELRIEDDDGWPLRQPDRQGMLHLDPGRYRLTLIPDGGVGRAIGRITQQAVAPELSGHGPHPLALNGSQAFRWVEPAKSGDPRTPDQWDFALLAPTDLSVTVTDGMVGEIIRLDAAGTGGDVVARPLFRRPVKPFAIRLDPGRYRLALRSNGPNNRFDYRIDTKTKQLLAGQTRTVTLPADVPFALGADGVAIVETWGAVGIKATVTGTGVRIVDDGRTDDWNARIAQPLPAGAYAIHLEKSVQGAGVRPPASTEPASGDESSDADNTDNTDTADSQPDKTMVALRLPADHEEPALSGDADLTVGDADLHSYPLVLRADRTVQIYAAHAVDSLGMALEQAGADGRWTLLDQASGTDPALAMMTDPAPGARYRLRVWTMAGTGTGFTLAARSVAPAEQPPGKVALTPLEGAASAWAVAAVQLPAPSLLEVGEAVRGAGRPGAPLVAAPRGVLAADGEHVALLGRDASVPVLVRILEPAAGKPVSFTVAAGRTAQVAGAVGDSGVTVWTVEARAGVPGIAAGGAPMAAVGDQAVAVGPGPVTVWNAGDAGDLAVTVARRSMALPEPAALSPGTVTVTLDDSSARAWRLADGVKRLQLDLPPATAAVLDGGTAPTTIWSGRRAASRTLDTDATRLLLIRADAGSAPASIAWTPVAAAQAFGTVGADGVFRRFFGTAGSLELPIAAAAPALHVRGPDAAATVIGVDGRVWAGLDPTEVKPGRVIVRHGPGLVAAWLDGGAGGLWPAAAPEMVSAPSTRSLSGQAQALRLHLDKPAMVHVRSSAPVLAALRTGLGISPIELFANGADFNRYAPAGDADLLLQSAADGPLTGSVELATTEVLPIGEGLGPRLTLGPGASRLFGFQVAQPTAVGVGVRAAIDIADCRLLDAAGHELGRGVVQMHDLAVGAYVLAVSVPADAPTLDLQPAVVGLAKPDDGPPPDVRAKYLELVGLADDHRTATP